MLDGKVRVDVPGFQLSERVWLGEGAEVHPDAEISGAAVIGANARVDAGAHIGEYSVLGTNVRVRAGAHLERAVLHDNAYVGENVALRGTIVGRSSDLRRGARCEEGVVLGDECFVGEDARIASGVKVYPFKTVEAGAIVNSSIVWESRGARSLFGRHGVAGIANVDITPELAARLAMAWASSLAKDATVVTSRDSSRASRMLKRAVMAGLNASGVNVLDLEVASVPVTRFAVRQPMAAGGMSVRLVEGDSQSVIMRFFDENGLDVTETTQRKIERLFNREDFRRVFASEIGDIAYPPRALEQYTAALEESVDAAAIRDASFKLVVDYGYGSTSFLMPNVLAKLGADVLGVNPFAATGGVVDFDRTLHAERVADLVTASGAHLGAVIDPDGEHLTLIDDDGHVLDDTTALLAMVSLVSAGMEGSEIAVPVSTTSAVEALAEAHGAKVRYTKLSTSALMEAASQPAVGFAAGGDGGYIVPRFLPSFDAVAALVSLLEVLATRGTRLSKVVAEVPEIHLVRESVVTPWEQKGLVMRTLVERNQGRRLELVDGVKVHHEDGWALALPDPDEQLTHIWAEADTDAAARRLAEEYARRIRALMA